MLGPHRCEMAEPGSLTCFSLDACPHLLDMAVECLGGSVLLLISIILKMNCWPAGSLIESKRTASASPSYEEETFSQCDLESHIGNEWHVFESS